MVRAVSIPAAVPDGRSSMGLVARPNAGRPGAAPGCAREPFV